MSNNSSNSGLIEKVIVGIFSLVGRFIYRLITEPVRLMANIGEFVLLEVALFATIFLLSFFMHIIGQDSLDVGQFAPLFMIALPFVWYHTGFRRHRWAELADYMRPCRAKKDDESVLICISRQLETRMEKWFGAEGRGLNEKLDSILEKGVVVPEKTVKSIRFIAAVRNGVVHGEDSSRKLPPRAELFETAQAVIVLLRGLTDHPDAKIKDGKPDHPALRFGLAVIGGIGSAGFICLVFR